MKDIFIRCLGPPEFLIDNETIHFQRNKTVALIVYLYLSDRFFSRDELLELLWPESEPTKARANLRTILSDCRIKLGSDFFSENNKLIGLDSEKIKSDYSDFITLSASDNPKELKQVEKLLKGDFLKGIAVSKAPIFDEWLYEIRQYVIVEYETVLEKLSIDAQKRNDLQNGIYYLKKLINLNPYREDYHRALISLHAETNDYNSAVHQYEILKKFLEEDDSTPPEAETIELMQRIKVVRKIATVNRNPSENKKLTRKSYRKYIIAISAIIICILSAVLIFHYSTDKKKNNNKNITIAVLPFNFLCNDNNAKGFSEIFTMDMINSLAAEDYMSVTPALSVGKYKDSVLTVKQIGEELNVKHIIHGSAMSFSECIRFSVQLIDVTANECTWTGSFSCESDNSLMTQNEVIEYLKENIIKEIDRPQ